MIDFYPEGHLANTKENKSFLSSSGNLLEACNMGKILESRVLVCDNDHNLIVDLGCIKGIIQREEGAVGIKEGEIRDIAIISKVNHPVCFVVKGIEKDKYGNDIAILSRREAQELCYEKYISNLRPGDILPAKVTHMESFGAFVDIGCGIISFLPIDTISISRISHPKERFKLGMNIRVIVKSLQDGKVNLTHKELLGTWEENASLFSIGETVAGVIRSVESYGVFVELTPNLAGLAEVKDGLYQGQQTSVYIKNIIPEKMKIKLVIIDAFEGEGATQSPKYFFEGDHIDKFIYSPDGSSKIIETIF